jgi:predicted kinase
VLPFYLAYRAMVRAKIAALRVAQLQDAAERDALLKECADYVVLAGRYATVHPTGVVVMHGLSGSGKTTLSGQLAERLPGIRVRTDVERRRIRAAVAAAGGDGVGRYSADETRAAYAAVEAAIGSAVTAGFVAIADGAFLRRAQRDRVREFAARLGVPCVVASTTAPIDVLRARVAARQADGQDASEADVAVLEQQLAAADELSSAERANAVVSGPATALVDIVAGIRVQLSGR